MASVILSGCSVKRDLQLPDAVPAATDQIRDSTTSVLSAISKAEKDNGIQPGLLRSIAVVESKCNPYAVNVGGRSYSFGSRSSAANFIKNMVRAGRTNLSVGCLQLHYKTHKGHFSSIDDMLTPERNIAYAAGLLRTLRDRYGSWEKATQRYHTSSSRRGRAYYRNVIKARSQT